MTSTRGTVPLHISDGTRARRLSHTISPILPAARFARCRCPWTCTANVPSAGIKVFNSLLHAHTAGVAVRTSLSDKNGNFKQSLGTEDYYDFNYQTPIPLDVTMHKDDEIHTRCTYNTEGRTKSTLFGLATGDEMCLTYLWYGTSFRMALVSSLSLTQFRPSFPRSLRSPPPRYYPAMPDSGRCLFTNASPVGIQQGGLMSIVPDPYDNGRLPLAVCDASFINIASPNDLSYPEVYCEREVVPKEEEKWLVNGGGGEMDLEQLYDNVEVVNDKVSIYYTVDSGTSELHMAIRADTEGWVGVGFGGGKMKGSDIIMGWVNEDGGWVSDRFAEGNWEPAVDEVQDYYNLAVYSATCEVEDGGACQWVKGDANPVDEDVVLGAGAGKKSGGTALVLVGVVLMGLLWF
jgi:hypothetical protein